VWGALKYREEGGLFANPFIFDPYVGKSHGEAKLKTWGASSQCKKLIGGSIREFCPKK